MAPRANSLDTPPWAMPSPGSMRTPHIASGLAALALVLTVISPVGAESIPVTECGTRFSGHGYLVHDLDCSGYQYGVEIDAGSLSLSGFTLFAGNKYGVLCHRSCKVVNGTIVGAQEDGIVAIKNLMVVNLTSRDNGFTGIKAGAAVVAEHSVFTGNARAGVQGLRRAKLKDVVSRDNGFGAEGGASASVIDAEIVDNATGGVASERIVVTRSLIRDNHSGDECGVTLSCADLITAEGKPPKLKESTCETSHRGGTFITGENWGVCSLD